MEKDKKALEDYIMKLLNISYIDARIHKQIKQYTNGGISLKQISRGQPRNKGHSKQTI